MSTTAHTSGVQGPLWGARARDWADVQERQVEPLYLAVFQHIGVGPGMTMLDAGCGAGRALQIAAGLGATVAGLDASEPLARIARERVPDADLRLGELERLPFPDAAFDAVTGFNSFQFAGDPAAALREAARVTRTGGVVAVGTWGAPEDCQTTTYLKSLADLMPPLPPGSPGPFALSAPGALEQLVRSAGLTPEGGGDVATPFVYPDLETAVRGLLSAGPAVRAIQQNGEDAVRAAVIAALSPFADGKGGYRMENTFRYLISRAVATD